MFKRVLLITACVAMMSLTFTACKKTEQPAPSNDVAVPASGTPAAEAMPVQDAVQAPASEAPVVADKAPAAEAKPIPAIPPEAQASVDAMIDVMTSIANAAKKDTCAEVLAELKTLQTNDDVKQKLLRSKDIEKFPQEVIMATSEANKARLLGLINEMAAFQKCESSPEGEAIDAVIKSILAPIASQEDEAPWDAPAPAANAPADKLPAGDAPAAKEPMVKEPAAKAPVDDKPAVE